MKQTWEKSMFWCQLRMFLRKLVHVCSSQSGGSRLAGRYRRGRSWSWFSWWLQLFVSLNICQSLTFELFTRHLSADSQPSADLSSAAGKTKVLQSESTQTSAALVTSSRSSGRPPGRPRGGTLERPGWKKPDWISSWEQRTNSDLIYEGRIDEVGLHWLRA